MTLKRRLFVLYIDFVKKISLRLKTSSLVDFERNVDMCFITIAFNNVFLIEQQIRLMKKHIKDTNFIYIIADNSDSKEKREQIKNLCQKENVEYISLPFNWFQKVHTKVCYGHGLSMTWIYHNVIKKLKPKYFGYLDHDIFPINNYSVVEKIQSQDFFGRLNDRTPENSQKPLWYLWAGFCFFRFDKVKNLNMSFYPCVVDGVYLDTAGSVYLSVYKNYSLSELYFGAPLVEKYFREGDNNHSHLLHFIDNDWVHTINGSNWKKVKDNKDDFLKDFLNQY